jgi:predicted nucleic acid-binding protein
MDLTRMRALLDTNILIDYLNGESKSRSEVEQREIPAISIITWMEVMTGAADADQENALRLFLSRFEVIGIDGEIATLAVKLRRTLRLKLPDAIIYATAKARRMLLVTRNSKDFRPQLEGVAIPYQL